MFRPKGKKAAERRAKLLVWLLNNGSNYVYDIWRDCRIRLYHLYPLLTRLEAEGLVTRNEVQDLKGSVRALYGLSETGLATARRLRASGA